MDLFLTTTSENVWMFLFYYQSNDIGHHMAHVRPSPLVPTSRHYLEVQGLRLKTEQSSRAGLMACISIYIYICVCVCVCIKVNWSRYRPGLAQRVGRGITLLFHDRGTRRGWVVSSTPRPHFTPGKEPVPILQEARLAPGPVWTGEKSRRHWGSIPNRPASSQSLYRLSYPAHWNKP
jgi:hypothetical protein